MAARLFSLSLTLTSIIIPSTISAPTLSVPTFLQSRQDDQTVASGTGPAGIVCYSIPDSRAHDALPVGSGITWYLTIPAASLPAQGLPLANTNQGTGSALSDALRHKCGLGITYEHYNDVGGGLAATFTTPVTCRDGSVHDAIDDAFHKVGAASPHAYCTNPDGGDSPDGGEIAGTVWEAFWDGLEALGEA